MVTVVYDLVIHSGVWSRNGLGFCEQESINVQHQVPNNDHGWFWPYDGRLNPQYLVDDETLTLDGYTIQVLM